MDEAKNRLFVSHGDRVHVVDVRTGSQLTEFDGLKGVHGIALANDFKKGYITNGTDNSITIFDYNT
ncbi:YncE family protein, partial [Serratia marcescens]|uniref:YncE family protein n=1 Tax=Serratia marcescens TaxID=615 RepID=UPI0019544444